MERANFATSYTGTRLVLVSPYLDSDEWERHFFSLDLSGEKRFKNGLAIFIKGNNLLNTKRERYLKTTNEYNANILRTTLRPHHRGYLPLWPHLPRGCEIHDVIK